MTDPFRLRVLKAVTAQIKTVTPANGYAHDLSDHTDAAGRPAARVFRGRDQFGTSDPLPMISILEDFRPTDPQDSGAGQTAQTGDWKLLIQGFVKDDHDNPLDPVYHLGADVVTALVRAKKDRRDILGLGYRKPCVSGLKIGQMVARPSDGDVSDVAFFYLSLTLTLVEDLETPFS